MGEPYVPKVGDVVRWMSVPDEMIVVEVGDVYTHAKYLEGEERTSISLTHGRSHHFVREGTKDEKKRFNLLPKKSPTSRPDRWAACVADAKKALEETKAAADRLKSALEDIESVREDYQTWRDNLPENMQSSATGEKLNTVCDLDFDHEVDLDEIENVLTEAEGVDLPQGFGRD